MTENTDVANVTVDNSEKGDGDGLSDELKELKKEIILMKDNETEEIGVKKNEEAEGPKNDTGSLLKQLDDELDELDNSNDDPIQSLLEEAHLLEENQSEVEKVASNEQTKINLEINPQPSENENVSDASNEEEKAIDPSNEEEKAVDISIEKEEANNVSNEDINDGGLKIIEDGDFKIIDEIGDENVGIVNSEEKKDEKNEKDTAISEDQPTQMEVEEDKKEQETVCKTLTKNDEQPYDETIVLESDEEEMHKESDATVICKGLSTSKRSSVDDNLVDVEEPPSKRARSSPNKDVSTDMIPEDAEERNDKTVSAVENLLVVASGNRRRSETDIEMKPIEKRAGSPIEEDSDSFRKIKISRAESVDSTSEDTKKDTNESEEKQSIDESLAQENGETSENSIITNEEKTETKTDPINIKDIELDPKPDEPNETEENHSPLSIEFLKTFKKSFHLMNRSDLEDFVLQKVVEAIINKSEVSELRQKNEAQEKTISNQRQRINDLAKQFRDLEMVHNRVTKDLETKSTGLVTPVKITRAVGLQVSQPRPKTDYRPMYSQPNQRVPPFPSRSPQRPNNHVGNMSPIQPGQRMNMALRQGLPQNNPTQFTQSKTSPIRHIGQVANNTQAKMIAMQKQQAMQRQSVMQQPRIQPPVLQRTNSGALGGRSPLSLGTPGPQQRSPTVLNSLLSNQQSRGSPVVLRKIIRPGPASVQQAQIQAMSQQQKSGQNKFIDLTDEEEAAQSPPHSNNATATKIHVKSPATLNSSVIAPNIGNGLSRGANAVNSSIPNKLPIQRTPGNQFIQITPKVGQNASQAQLIRRQVVSTVNQKRMHPAPLPIIVNKSHNPEWKRPPPRPQIRINNIDAGIVISWTIHEPRLAEDFDPIVKYQIYAYQETNQPPATESWRHVGDVKAMALPMAVTLTQFQEGQRYHFAVRAVDEHERAGTFSVPRTWDEKT